MNGRAKQILKDMLSFNLLDANNSSTNVASSAMNNINAINANHKKSSNQYQPENFENQTADSTLSTTENSSFKIDLSRPEYILSDKLLEDDVTSIFDSNSTIGSRKGKKYSISHSGSSNPIIESSIKRSTNAATSDLWIDYAEIEEEEMIRIVEMNFKTSDSSIVFANL